MDGSNSVLPVLGPDLSGKAGQGDHDGHCADNIADGSYGIPVHSDFPFAGRTGNINRIFTPSARYLG